MVQNLQEASAVYRRRAFVAHPSPEPGGSGRYPRAPASAIWLAVRPSPGFLRAFWSSSIHTFTALAACHARRTIADCSAVREGADFEFLSRAPPGYVRRRPRRRSSSPPLVAAAPPASSSHPPHTSSPLRLGVIAADAQPGSMDEQSRCLTASLLVVVATVCKCLFLAVLEKGAAQTSLELTC
jgi:hypothetical protein